MSSHNYVYMGPYLEVPHAHQEVEERPSYTCTANKQHGGKYGMKFCSECGAPVDRESRTITKVSPINMYSICEDLKNEAVWQPESLALSATHDDVGVWLCNLGRLGRDLDDDEVVCLTTVDSSTFADDITAFSELVQPHMRKLLEKFGVEAVVKYGIVSYYS